MSLSGPHVPVFWTNEFCGTRIISDRLCSGMQTFKMSFRRFVMCGLKAGFSDGDMNSMNFVYISNRVYSWVGNIYLAYPGLAMREM